MLDQHGMLADDGTATRFGKPALRRVPCPQPDACPTDVEATVAAGPERSDVGGAPQRLMDATEPQRNLVACAFATPWAGPNSCALWVEEVYARLGYGVVTGHARDLCRSYCSRTDLGLLKVGMIVGVERHPYTPAGLAHGHVGFYLGDGQVRDCADGGLRTSPLEAWLSVYGVMDDPRWGWLGGVDLEQVRRTV